MFDPNTQSIGFYHKNLERQLKPRMRDYRAPANRSNTTLRLISVIGLIVVALPFIPWS